MARLDNPDLWVARIQEQLVALARGGKVSLDTGDPVKLKVEVEGERYDIGEALVSGDTITVRINETFDMEE